MLREEVDLLVAPLNTDVTLGMPILQRERIVVDAANRDIVTPRMEAETKSKSSRPACHTQVGGEIRNTTTRNHVDPTEITPTQPKPSSADKTQGGAPTITPEMARKHHAECVKEFSDVFNHKAPTFNSRNRPKDAPYHRIQLKDPNKSINGRMFTLPERYMN